MADSPTSVEVPKTATTPSVSPEQAPAMPPTNVEAVGSNPTAAPEPATPVTSPYPTPVEVQAPVVKTSLWKRLLPFLK